MAARGFKPVAQRLGMGLGQKRTLEKLWLEFFADPSQWWDHRSEKSNARYPDFKHKETKKALWLNSELKPSWVEAELAAMSPGFVQSNIFSWNIKLARYVRNGQYEKTMELFHQMEEEGTSPDRFTFVRVLNACASLHAIGQGRRLHTQIIRSGCLSNVYVASSLVDMYAKCGCIEDASEVFKNMPTRDVVAWNAMILGYVKCGKGQKALELSEQMWGQEVEPVPGTFVALLNACASLSALEKGRSIHDQISQRGFESDVFVRNSLIDMYAKCGSIDSAWQVFNKVPTPDVVAWNAMIMGFVKCGQARKALDLFWQMQREGLDPVPATFVAVLNACASMVALDEGRHVHEQVLQRGFESDAFVGSSLVDMYAKCGSIGDAWRVFKKMSTRNVVAWNALIFGNVKCGQEIKALELYQQMQLEGVDPGPVTFVGVLNACASVQALERGRCVHHDIIQRGYESEKFVVSSLVDMYSKCGSIQDAESVFNKFPNHDVVSWNTMILAHVKCGEGYKALELSQEMQFKGVEADTATFVAILHACASVAALEEGRQVHGQIIQRGFECDVIVVRSLVDMYAKCGSIKDAEKVFRKMNTPDRNIWDSMIMGYVKCQQGQKAIELFQKMQLNGLQPDTPTFVGVLNACASVYALEEGRRVHEQIIQKGCESDVSVGSSVVDMYVKCGSIDNALRVFNKMPIRNALTWTTMILGHAKCGQGQKALELFRLMEREGVDPVPATFVGVLNACASLGALEEGRRAHERTIQNGFASNVFIGSSLITMYCKCGSINEAWVVFNQMPKHDVVSWNSIILGFVKCGQGQKALELFRQMQQKGLQPVSVTFVAVLKACASLALLDEGRRIHAQIVQRECESDIFVGSSLVDMYCKCGSIDDAWMVFKRMPTPDVVSWNAIILGHVKCGQGQRALRLYQQMQLNGVKPVVATFLAALNACASSLDLEEGKHVHTQIMEQTCESDVLVGNCLVNMYAKCGSVENAWTVFSRMPMRDVVSWSAMILGYVKCGQAQKALYLFRQMLEVGVEPVPATFVGVLNACASVAALEEGTRIHEYINQRQYELDVFVGNALIDMYAKCGSIEGARKVFNNMQIRDVVSWNALLGGYAMHGCAEKALGHFDYMSQAGVNMDRVTFVSLLTACGHAGLVDEGFHYFESMSSVFGIPATVEHCTGVVDLLGRAGHLFEAEDLIRRMSCEPSATIWMSLLSSCRVHGNVEMAEHISKEILKLEPRNAAGFVLLSNMYAATGN